MEAETVLRIFSYGIGIVGVAGAIYSLFKYSNYKATVQLQNDNIKALKDKLSIIESDLADEKRARAESEKTISNLEGKLQSYKEIPLQQISTSLVKLAESNQQILTTLKQSAIIAAAAQKEGGLLVQTKEGQTATVQVTNQRS